MYPWSSCGRKEHEPYLSKNHKFDRTNLLDFTTMMISRTLARRVMTTSVLRVPDEAVLQTIRKRAGDAISYGETFALLKPTNSSELISLLSPVSGQLLDIKAKEGDIIRANAEFATFEGRKPLIQFRHVKGEAAAASSTTTTTTTTAATQVQQPVKQEQTKSEVKKIGSKKSFMELPPFFGRLPPLSAKEAALLHSGGAYDT